MTTSTRAPDEAIDRHFDQLTISQLESSQSFLVRPSVPDPARWPFLALYVLRGTARLSSGARLVAADFTVVATGRSLQVEAGEHSAILVIRIPRAALGHHESAMRNAVDRVHSTAAGTASLVGHLLTGVAAQSDDYVPENPGLLAQHLVGFITLLCHTADPQGRQRMLADAKEYIEEHLADIDLGPERIAAHASVSTRTLHRLFEADGTTVRAWIRARRLEHCRVQLADPAWDGLPVSGVGARWGLWDAAHFSRLFKASYGMSPRQYRTAARQAAAAPQRRASA